MKTNIYIQNLKCHGCGNTITNHLIQIESIQKIEINFETQMLTFDYDNENALVQAKLVLKKIGYPEQGEENSMVTKAKSYVSCAIGKLS